MRRLFTTLRGLINDRPARPQAATIPAPLANFERRAELLAQHAEQATSYEDDLLAQGAQFQADMDSLRAAMEQQIDDGRDRYALEYLRLAVRLRPGLQLIQGELASFRVVSEELMRRAQALFDNIDAAMAMANDPDTALDSARALDHTLTQLTRYFVLLERVANNRRATLGERLAERLGAMIDDHQLDLELAGYILARRRALSGGASRSALPPGV